MGDTQDRPQILSVTPNIIDINGLDEASGYKDVRIVATYSDSDGASAIERGYVGMSQCSINPGAAYGSNFEHNFANYFGAYYNITGAWGGVATNNAAALCDGNTDGSGSPWTSFWAEAGHELPMSNPNSMITVMSHTRVPNVVNKTIDFIWNLRIDTNISAGTYYYHGMVSETAAAGGSYQNHGKASWSEPYWTGANPYQTVFA